MVLKTAVMILSSVVMQWSLFPKRKILNGKAEEAIKFEVISQNVLARS